MTYRVRTGKKARRPVILDADRMDARIEVVEIEVRVGVALRKLIEWLAGGGGGRLRQASGRDAIVKIGAVTLG